MKKVTLSFKNNAKLHIGEELYDYISSDKLYSMIINALSYIISVDELNGIVNLINEKVRISSAFLGLKVTKNNISNNIEFLPKPYILIKEKEISKEIEEENLINRKKYKNILWISSNSFGNMSKNYDLQEDLINYSFKNGFIIDGKYYVENEEVDEDVQKVLEDYSPIKKDMIQRNIIDRYTKESLNTYYDTFSMFSNKETDCIRIEPYLYFFLDDKEEILKDNYIQALQFISIGGKRSLGAGVVEKIGISNYKLDIYDNEKIYINFSMIYPNKKDLSKISKYSLENRNGFIFSKRSTNIKKPTLRMIKEGSIFNGKAEGEIYSLKVDGVNHDIHVYGKAFLSPFGGEK
ncbi:type III-A CRISPR-associated RAMP protein Csm4 [Clostridium drakei]|uniref:CRISPR system Cms protein Csm4 n=1 Tax=Clostridium drakei TaxID=332101 RepID=A0A2U8DSM9_9CLOT|nr:type III-A CRISPR-associated RAMP protein Csm4 [Clostridium drakei]AWI05773.1 type III-A CRISPR-associated RAMP protein Csm4 [Clostridium drakei]